jgi:hypothetical protein
MKKYDGIILRILAYGFPLVMGLLIWAYTIVGNNKTLHTDDYSGGIWNLAGIFFIVWVLLAILTLFRLLINSTLREQVLSKVARVQERDEREAEISGYASKFSLFANLALLVCLLFFSTININVKKYNKDVVDQNGEKKHGLLSIGFGLKAYDDKAIVINENHESKEINYNELPVSKSGIIILLIIWQLGMYHFSARSRLKVE